MLRDFVPADFEEYMDMSRDFYSGDAVVHPVPETHFKDTFEKCLAHDPMTRGLVFEQDGRILGYALLSFTHSNEAGGLVVLVEEVYLREEARGLGLGRAFFDFLETDYAHAKRFRLEVSHDNVRARQLYERLGYQALDYIQMVKPF